MTTPEAAIDRRVVCIFLALLLLPACAGRVDEDSVWVVRDVSVIPMDEERVLSGQTVLVRDGRIEALGTSAEIEVPEGARVIDGAGRFLIPGLFDTHVHLNEEERDGHLALYLRSGVTTVQSMHGSPRHLELRERVASGELLGPRILTTGPTTARARVDSPEKAEAFVREQKAAGYDAIKQYGDGSGTMTRETYARLIDVAHEQGLRVVGHAPRNMPFSVVLEEGQDSIDHMEEIIYTYEPITEAIGPLLDLQFGRVALEDVGEALESLPDLRPLMAPAVRELATRAKATGLVVTPTLTAFETIWLQTTPRYPELLRAAEMRYMSPITRFDWGPELNGYRRGWADRLEAMDRVLGRSLELQKTIVTGFHDAGVPVLVGTDAPLTFVYPGFAVHRELALLVDCGLTPYEALRAATAAPATALGLADETGTIEAGKRADLVLLDGNPLEDVAHADRIVGVAAAGRWHDRADLDARVEELARLYEPVAEAIDPLLPLYGERRPDAMVAAYRELTDPDPEVASLVERLVNRLGYSLLNDDGDAEAAVAAFRLNTEAFPDSSNVWDSLGEGLLSLGELDEATASYRRSLELDPENENAERMIEWMKPVVAAREAPPSLTDEQLAAFAGDYGPRHVELRDGTLYYHRDGGTERPLRPIDNDLFALEGLATFRMRFERDDAGRPVKIVGLYSDGRTDESPRDGS
jgi:imidazolonepropionase-like amidohydrolase